MSSAGFKGVGNPRTFVVHLKNPEGALMRSITDKFPEHYSLSDSSLLIRTPLLASQVAELVGLGTEGGPVGAVFKLNQAFAGYYDSDLWDWLDAG